MPERPTVRFRRIGNELRRLRDSHGLTLEQAGTCLDRSPSSLSRIENGYQPIRARELAYILDRYEVTGPLRESLLDLAVQGRKKDWWFRYENVLSPEALDYISLEADATTIRIFETIHIPGLFQTEHYARAVIAAGRATREPRDEESLVAVRLARQSILKPSSSPRVQAVITEAAVRQIVGGPGVMRAQLQRLIELSNLDGVTLQAIPFSAGAHVGFDGPFTLLDVGERGDLRIVLVESLTRSWYIEQEEDVDRYGRVFDQLCATALSPPDTRAFIQGILSDHDRACLA